MCGCDVRLPSPRSPRVLLGSWHRGEAKLKSEHITCVKVLVTDVRGTYIPSKLHLPLSRRLCEASTIDELEARLGEPGNFVSIKLLCT